MHELTDRELYQALEYARSLDQNTGRRILEQFQLDQFALTQTIFGILPAIIAEQNQDMANLFMDLCFDVICVYQKAFGPMPLQKDMDPDWLEKQAMLLDAELQSLMTDKHMDEKVREKLQDRLRQRSLDETGQAGLVSFMNAAIDDFASENPVRVPAIKTTQTMIFVVIRLFNNLYSRARGQ
ncbi:hypothetical protein [Candidatus Methylomicrobium oryzae]|uniref:hypothetical protein n=1 Tax=Candidatus Methylomicrobium oryzae TaxID=2802053 RepID=UPI0019239A05|nr:hypothetical protein [Methylomicrobium sp. RS1]MBL1265816.1 hypothetical protein [Methylomicrobium sp. RS1]